MHVYVSGNVCYWRPLASSINVGRFILVLQAKWRNGLPLPHVYVCVCFYFLQSPSPLLTRTIFVCLFMSLSHLFSLSLFVSLPNFLLFNFISLPPFFSLSFRLSPTSRSPLLSSLSHHFCHTHTPFLPHSPILTVFISLYVSHSF